MSFACRPLDRFYYVIGVFELHVLPVSTKSVD